MADRSGVTAGPLQAPVSPNPAAGTVAPNPSPPAVQQPAATAPPQAPAVAAPAPAQAPQQAASRVPWALAPPKNDLPRPTSEFVAHAEALSPNAASLCLHDTLPGTRRSVLLVILHFTRRSACHL